MAELVTTSTGVHYDDLIGGTNVSVVAQNVKVTAGTAMARGTLLTITDGTAAATACLLSTGTGLLTCGDYNEILKKVTVKEIRI